MIETFIIELISTTVVAVVVIALLRHIRQAERGMKTSMTELQASLKQTTLVLHEYKKFKTAFDNSFDAVVIADAKGNVQFMNSSVTRVTGYAASDAVGKKAGTLWGKQMNDKYYQRLWNQVLKERQPYVGRIVNKRKNGELYLADVTISPILDEDAKKVEFFVAVERDLGTPPRGAIAALNAGKSLAARYGALSPSKKI